MVIQWYPGHIAKVERQLGKLLSLADVVVEVLDARMPLATTNPRLRRRYGNKPVLLLLNKADLADPEQNRRWQKQLTSANQEVMLYNALTGKSQKPLLNQILALAEAKRQGLEAQGLKRRPVRALIAGMPNVGKSSLINSLSGTHQAATGHKAGVTRTPRWIRVHPEIDLLDTPGIIPPRLEDADTGMLLATVHSVGDAAFDDETAARFLLTQLLDLYPHAIQKHYGLPDTPVPDFEQIAEKRQSRRPGGELDTQRAAQQFLAEFRQGRLGRLSLQHADPH